MIASLTVYKTVSRDTRPIDELLGLRGSEEGTKARDIESVYQKKRHSYRQKCILPSLWSCKINNRVVLPMDKASSRNTSPIDELNKTAKFR